MNNYFEVFFSVNFEVFYKECLTKYMISIMIFH